ncbi:MAG: DUF3822 family protein [Cyclobacteriaceae bacterium]
MDRNPRHKLVRRLKDDLFNEEALDTYDLSVLAGSNDFQLIVTSSKEGKLLLLEDYVFPDSVNGSRDFNGLRYLFDSHQLLQAGFWKSISIGFKNQKYTQIPGELFDEKNAFDILKINAVLEENDKIFWNDSSSGIKTIFGIPDSVYSWLGSYYPKSKIHFAHQSAILIAGVDSVHKGDEAIYAFIDRFRLHLLAMTGNSLKFYNQFQIKTFSDYTRYLMLVVNQIGFSQENCKVLLHGFVGNDSPHFQELRKYIRNLATGNRPNISLKGGVLSEIQEHQFFDIFAMPLTR